MGAGQQEKIQSAQCNVEAHHDSFCQRMSSWIGHLVVEGGVHHATDLRVPKIADALICICRYKGELSCLWFEHKMQASMKKAEYHTSTAFTKDDLLGCGMLWMQR